MSEWTKLVDLRSTPGHRGAGSNPATCTLYTFIYKTFLFYGNRKLFKNKVRVKINKRTYITTLSTMNGKVCKTCNVTKPFSEFWLHKKSKDGYRWSCKICEGQNNKASVETRKEKEELGKQEKKQCSQCEVAKPFSSFYKEKKGKFGLKSKCKQCLEKHKSDYGLSHKVENTEYQRPKDFDYHQQESNAIDYIKTFCVNHFVTHKCVEGALVDFCIKPNNIECDLWLPFQMKSTHGIGRDSYSFSICRDYDNIFVMNVSLTDGRIWIFDSNDLKGRTTLTIGINSSTYNKSEVINCDLIQHLLDLYNNSTYKKQLSVFDTPISPSSKKEQSFFRFRESIFPNFTYIYPEVDGRAYDLIINQRFKLQDKVISEYTDKQNKTNRKKYSVSLCRASGTKNQRPYKLGDNNFYWFHLQDKTGAYIIPEQELFKHQMINSEDTEYTVPIHIIIYPYPRQNMKPDNKTLWMNEYLFHYDNPEHIDKIHKMFNINE